MAPTSCGELGWHPHTPQGACDRGALHGPDPPLSEARLSRGQVRAHESGAGAGAADGMVLPQRPLPGIQGMNSGRRE